VAQGRHLVAAPPVVGGEVVDDDHLAGGEAVQAGPSLWLYWISSTWLARVSLLAIVVTPRPRRMVIPHDSSPGSTFVVKVASSSRKSVMSSVANSNCSNSATAEPASVNLGATASGSDPDIPSAMV
jgi:hypothetical protein